ncbi:hypothetical protein HJA95_02795, partial [Rhizobium binae]
YAKDHHLAVGQGLTPEQAAALTKSIVLYQFQTVNGVQVLAPVVYVAAADRKKLSGAGAAMAGGSIDMNVGNLDNSGLIASAGNLAVSGSSIEGSGTFLSRGDTALNATNGITLAAQTMTIGGQNVVNTNAGVTAGRNLQLAAGSGDLALTGVKVNATGDATLTGKNVTLAAAKVDNAGQPAMTAGGHAENATGSQVTSGGALTIKATDNVNIIGSSAKAGTTLDVTADNGSVAVVSTDIARNNQSGYTRTLSTDQQQSQLSAGTNATIKSGDDILLSGSSVTAGGNVALSAGDDINITAAQEQSASTFGKKSASSITHVGSEISAGGDLSVTAGNGSGDHDLNIVGSQLSADGNLALKADGDVTIAEATDTATLDTRLSTKGGFLGKSEKTTTHLETTTAVGSSISGGAGVDITSGKDTVISASKIEAGNEAGAADLNITTKGDLIIASGKDTSAKDDKGSRSGFLSKGSSSYKSYDETTVASELGASGNINLDAGGAAVIAGSNVDADGAINVVGDSVSVIGAAEQHQLEITRKKSGLFVGSGDGFVSLWGKEQKSGKQASELNVASVLSAGTDVALKSRDTDVNILGSQIYADQNITLDAARDVNITPGTESESSQEKEKRSGFGISFGSSSGGFSVGIGMSSVSDTTKEGSQTNAMATLSAANDLTIKAGRDANLQAADVSAGRDVAITAERDVNLLSAEDKSNYESVHEQFFAGVTLSVSTGLVSAAQSIAGAAQKITGISDGYTAANAAFASLKAYDALQQLSGIAKDGGSIASVSLTAGFSYEKSSASSSTSTPVVTSVEAGRSVTIEATSGDLTGHGAQITAGYDYGVAAVVGDDKIGDITLKAGHDINLESAQATSETGSDSKSANASFGVNAGIGLQGVGLGVTGGAGAGMSKSDATSVTQVNSHVTGSGDITISSGNDTTLKGAVVSGNTITADIGGNLSIISTPDTGSSANSSASGGFSLSGMVGGNLLPLTTQLSGLEFGGGLGSGATNWISEQSGLLSTGKMGIEVGGNTELQAGKIISNSGDLSLSTDTLTYSDFLGQKGYEGFSAQIGIEVPGNELPGAPPANNTLEGSYQLDDTRQTVRATVGPGTITIRDEEKQAALEQSAATAPLADLNRDPDKAYEITRDKHVDLDIYVSVQSITAAIDAGKSIADALSDAFAKMAADGKISSEDMQSLNKLQQYANDPEVQKQQAECAKQASGVICQIKTSESIYGYTEVIPLTSDTAKVLAGAWSTAATAIAVGLVAYFYNTNSGEQFTSKTISLGGGLQGELSGNLDNGYLTLSITYPDKTSAIIKLAVTGTYGRLAVESAYGADGLPLDTDVIGSFVGQINNAGKGVLIVYNQGSGSGVSPPVPDAKPGNQTKGRSELWEKPGGLPEAEKDFNDKNPSNVKIYPNGTKVGQLPNGDTVIVRPISSDGRPTLEIQRGKKKIKVRYD